LFGPAEGQRDQLLDSINGSEGPCNESYPYARHYGDEVVPPARLSKYLIHVSHRGHPVTTEVVLAHDDLHAHKIGAYIARTAASYHVRPNDFDRNAVSFRVSRHGRAVSEATTPRSHVDRPTRALPGHSPEDQPTRAQFSRSTREDRASLTVTGLGHERTWIETGRIDGQGELAWMNELAAKRAGVYGV
jgi:hypothetical protein